MKHIVDYLINSHWSSESGRRSRIPIPFVPIECPSPANTGAWLSLIESALRTHFTGTTEPSESHG